MNEFAVAKVCENRFEADLLKAYLEAADIEVFIQADDAGGFLPNLSLLNGVFLLVPQKDLARAQEIIQAHSTLSED